VGAEDSFECTRFNALEIQQPSWRYLPLAPLRDSRLTQASHSSNLIVAAEILDNLRSVHDSDNILNVAIRQSLCYKKDEKNSK